MKAKKHNKAEEIIKIAMITSHFRNIRELADKTGLEAPTLRNNISNPDTMSIGRLRTIAEATGLTDNQIGEIVRAANLR